MQPHHIKVAVRPRNAWEAIDLGFMLVKHGWQPLFKLWLATMLPVITLIYLIFWQSPWWASFIIWLSKPWLDCIILFYLSQALFAQQPSIKDSYKAFFPLLLQKNLLWGGFLLRLSMGRAFALPVWQLETVQGKARRQRLRVLLKNHQDHSQWLNFACYCFEWGVYISLFMLILFFLPENSPSKDMLTHALQHQSYAEPWALGSIALLNIISLSLIEPFFVAAGFALYLNRRTHLEGWDIELSFRHMAQRLQTPSD